MKRVIVILLLVLAFGLIFNLGNFSIAGPVAVETTTDSDPLLINGEVIPSGGVQGGVQIEASDLEKEKLLNDFLILSQNFIPILDSNQIIFSPYTDFMVAFGVRLESVIGATFSSLNSDELKALIRSTEVAIQNKKIEGEEKILELEGKGVIISDLNEEEKIEGESSQEQIVIDSSVVIEALTEKQIEEFIELGILEKVVEEQPDGSFVESVVLSENTKISVNSEGTVTIANSDTGVSFEEDSVTQAIAQQKIRSIYGIDSDDSSFDDVRIYKTEEGYYKEPTWFVSLWNNIASFFSGIFKPVLNFSTRINVTTLLFSPSTLFC